MYFLDVFGDLALWISASAFLFYGASCFVSKYLNSEFLRYGLPHLRYLIGSMQISGALALLIGRYNSGFNSLAILGAGGLSMMMLVAIVVRFKIRDSLAQTVPALILFLLNGYILFFLWYMRSG